MQPEIIEIEKIRVAKGISTTGLSEAAGLARSTYWFISNGAKKAGPTTIRKLKAAVEKMSAPRRGRPAGSRAPISSALVAATYRGFLALLAREYDLDPEEVAASQPSLSKVSDPAWLAAARVRALAVYCTNVELNVPGRRVAEAAGMTKQAVSECLKRVEDLRDDPAIDALVERVSRLISGRVE